MILRGVKLLAGFGALCLFASAGRAGQNSPAQLPQNEQQFQGYRIAGVVVNAISGAPLTRARISIADTRARMQRIETITDEGGRFEFGPLPAGKYSLEGAKRGYISSSYEQHEQFSTAIVTGPGFGTEKLVLRLMPTAMIVGHVTDESGDPVRRAQVDLFMDDHSGGISRVIRREASTADDRGYFEFSYLPPGTYFVSVNAKPWYAVNGARRPGANGEPSIPASLNVAYPTTYYGGASEAEGAAPIQLKGGDHQEIEIHLTPVPALHLLFHFAVAADQRGPFRAPFLQKRVFDSVEFVQTNMRVISPGTVEVSGIPAGRYDVRIQGGEPSEAEQFSEMNLAHDGQDLTATEGEALGKLKVKLKMLGGEPLPREYGLALRDAQQRIVAFGQGTANGEVSLEAVRPGKYDLIIASAGKRYSVLHASTAAGAVDAHQVSIAPGTALEIQAEVVSGEVRIEGVAEKDGKPLAGVMVALVPDDPETHVDLFRRDQSDFDGSFTLPSVIPGTYTVVAVQDAWGFDWLKPGVLARYVQHGQEVIIGENMRGTLRLPQPLEVQGK